MRVLVASAAVLALALPVGAMAQSTTTTPSAGSSAGNTGSVAAPGPMDQNSAGTVGSRMHQANPAGQPGGMMGNTASQEQIRKSLEQAGFTNVRVLDSAYLVQARGANGETVTMMIDSSGSTASGSSMSGSSMMNGGMMGGGMGGNMSGNMGSMMGGSNATGQGGGSVGGATTGTGPGGSTGTPSGTTSAPTTTK